MPGSGEARRPVRAAVALCLAVGIFSAGCAVSPGPAQPPPVPGQPLASWVHQVEGRNLAELRVRNDSDDTYRFTAVILESCINVEQTCGTHPVDVLVEPGQTRVILTIRRVDPWARFFINWSYQAIKL